MLGLTRHPGATDPTGRLRAAARVAVPAAVALALLGLLLAWMIARADPWLRRALTSRLSVLTSLIALLCIALLAWMGSVMWRIGAAARRRRRPDGGSVLVEFALLLPIALMISLGLLQSSLLMAGNLCVHYAAFCAARSAIVQVPRYGGINEPENGYFDDDLQGKFGRVHMAAVWPVIPVSYGGRDQQEVDDAGLTHELGRYFSAYGSDDPFWLDARVRRKLAYAIDHTSVALSRPATGPLYGANEDLTARVRHTYYLSVPYAGMVFSKMFDDGVELGADGEYGLVIEARCTLTNQGEQDWIDIERFDVMN